MIGRWRKWKDSLFFLEGKSAPPRGKLLLKKAKADGGKRAWLPLRMKSPPTKSPLFKE